MSNIFHKFLENIYGTFPCAIIEALIYSRFKVINQLTQWRESLIWQKKF